MHRNDLAEALRRRAEERAKDKLAQLFNLSPAERKALDEATQEDWSKVLDDMRAALEAAREAQT